jgi:glycine oxidase
VDNEEHVVVVGAGAAGCATAYYLSAAGVRVTVVDGEGVGTQASGWSAGGINPLHGIPAPIAELALESFRLHLALWPALGHMSGLDLGARRISMAMVAPVEPAIPPLLGLRDAFDAAAADGFSAAWLDGAALRALEPRVTSAAGALVTQGNGVLDSYQFTNALAAAAQRQGAVLHAGTVTGLRHSDRRVTGVWCGEALLPCDAVVVAMGPWSQAAAAWLSTPLPVEPLKGEILRMAVPGPPLACDLVAPHVSLFGRAGGQVWIGSTMERRGFDTAASESARRTLLGAAVQLMPALAEASLERQTVCLRPVTADGLPVIGNVPDWDGVYVATGGGAKGILLAPAMGKAVAELLLTGRTALPIAACNPARFALDRL